MKLWVSDMILWLHSVMIIFIKGCCINPVSQKCSCEKEVLHFFSCFCLWDLGTAVILENSVKGSGDK